MKGVNYKLIYRNFGHGLSGGLHCITHLVSNFFFSKHIDGPCSLHFVTHLVPNLDLLEPLDLLVKS
ncbi:hypothetical protein Hanom_Chr07g00645001 [Helianthus anomalus]